MYVDALELHDLALVLGDGSEPHSLVRLAPLFGHVELREEAYAFFRTLYVSHAAISEAAAAADPKAAVLRRRVRCALLVGLSDPDDAGMGAMSAAEPEEPAAAGAAGAAGAEPRLGVRRKLFDFWQDAKLTTDPVSRLELLLLLTTTTTTTTTHYRYYY